MKNNVVAASAAMNSGSSVGKTSRRRLFVNCVVFTLLWEGREQRAGSASALIRQRFFVQRGNNSPRRYRFTLPVGG